ncbi:hypothetical protein PHYSODRAFT_469707 [Phytophthora sojae]|uniref:Reverse transcriptase zinc-binding domain-containing protein n=1 Tax=Phytophthora sojae (strain P6497) TaxID=1094619 RepID=G4YEL0_PHYSP|nr:hypothetical protein PHYSODRAFT_469707 [Phytophthora sojae]EGZ27287.1 hypothetical protein PHYSODRAFT_469707 [Phytophthora sojae]|eukprot:XP_009514562.1 hypothetical protein PHYSODRAFT_469707 [Phytophthora sojae]
MQRREERSSWGKAALTQSPAQLWDTNGLFTDYQNWTTYRITLGELNLYREVWPTHRACPEATCSTHRETIDHIIWECEKAQLSWRHWVSKWLGGECSQNDIASLQPSIAQRQPPAVTPELLAHSQQCTATWTPHHNEAMATLWRIWTTVTPVQLRRLRNDAVFNNEHSSPQETRAAVWSAGIYQVQAITAAWKK